MSTVDFVVAVVMILSIVLSVLRGFTREVLTLVALCGAVAAVVFGMPVIDPLFAHMFQSETTGKIAGGLIVGIVTLVILSLIGHQIGKMVTKSGLGTVDRTLGPIFGVARAALLLCILFIAIKWAYGENLPGWIKEAKSTPYIAKGAARIVAMLPPDIQADIQPEKDKDKKTDEDDQAPPEKPGAPATDDAQTAKPPAPPEKPADVPVEKDGEEGYGKAERGEMNRLLQNNETVK